MTITTNQSRILRRANKSSDGTASCDKREANKMVRKGLVSRSAYDHDRYEYNRKVGSLAVVTLTAVGQRLATELQNAI